MGKGFSPLSVSKAAMKHSIKDAAGSHVRLVNETAVYGDPHKLRIHIHGKLEAPLESEGEMAEWYVRIGDDPRGHGTNGIGFPANAVADVFRQPSGIWEITLKG